MTKYFKQKQLDVSVVSQAEEAEEKIILEQPDLIFLDYRMSPITGKDILERLHFLKLQIPVVMMSAYKTVDGYYEIRKLGAVEYIAKPYNFDEIEANLDKVHSVHSVRLLGLIKFIEDSGSCTDYVNELLRECQDEVKDMQYTTSVAWKASRRNRSNINRYAAQYLGSQYDWSTEQYSLGEKFIHWLLSVFKGSVDRVIGRVLSRFSYLQRKR